jgi:histidinol-phosphatase (PHP family)
MWANYHSHSKYCDGKGELAEYIEAARKAGIKTMGFSSHAPVPFDCKWTMKKENLPLYLKDFEILKKSTRDIEIYKSLEIDFIPGVVSPFEYKDELDYLIGSIHFVEQLPDGRQWEIDNTHAVFLEGLEKIFRNNFQEAIVRYFELTQEMIFSAAPDIIGHLDKIKMQNVDGKFFSEDDVWYRDEVTKLVNLLAQADTIVEVNTRGIYQKKTRDPYPSPWILEMVRKKNMRITISSDAHLSEDLTNQFPEMAKLLSDLGFKTLTVMHEGRWKQVPFDQNGILSI